MRNPALLVQLLTRDIWRVREKDLARPKAYFLRLLRIIVLTFRGISEDNASLRASALTFYSLLSIVPVLAMVFGIAKGFGFEKGLERVLLENLEGQEQVAMKIIEFSRAMLENVKGGVVAGVGVLVLFYTIIKILSHIENAFNDIWGVGKSRGMGRKVTDYLSIMLVAPVLFFMSSTMTVVITSGIQWVMMKISLLGAVAPAIFFLLKLLPYAVMWVLFSFMYIFIPNTKVHLISGILAGVVAGTVYQIFQWGYINLQIGVAKYNAVYGSFAALPLFFGWLQFSWMIVLLGAEVSFAHQNVGKYEYEKDSLLASRSFKRLLALRIVHVLVKRFAGGERPWDALMLSHQLGIPIFLVDEILMELVASGLVSEVARENERGVAYQPNRDPDVMTLSYVIDALDRRGANDIPVERSEEMEKIAASLKELAELVERSPANVRLKEL